MVRFRDVQLSNLQLRGLTYYLRRKVPLELREIIGPRELVESLATEDRTEVKARLSARLVEIAGGWAEARRQFVPAAVDPEAAALARLQAALDADHHALSFHR